MVPGLSSDFFLQISWAKFRVIFTTPKTAKYTFKLRDIPMVAPGALFDPRPARRGADQHQDHEKIRTREAIETMCTV